MKNYLARVNILSKTFDEAATHELCANYFTKINRQEFIDFELSLANGVTQEDAEAAADWIIEKLDVNKDSTIDLEEMVAGMMKFQAMNAQ